MSTSDVLDVLRRRAMPSVADYAGFRRSWRADLVAGITVGVVALPLALAFGVTSGVGASAGLVTAIVAGLRDADNVVRPALAERIRGELGG